MNHEIKESKKVRMIVLYALIFGSAISTTIFPSNTQVSDFSENLKEATRPVPSLDTSLYSCRYRPEPTNNNAIRVIFKSSQKKVDILIPAGQAIHYTIALSNKNIAIGSFSNGHMVKYMYTLSSSTLIRFDGPVQTFTKSAETLFEIKIGLPFIFGGNSPWYALIDTTIDTGQMVVFKDQFVLDPNQINRSVVPFSEKVTPRLIIKTRNRYIVRLSYVHPDNPPLSVDASIQLSFKINRMTRAPGTDKVFFDDADNRSMFYLADGMWAQGGPCILKKVVLPEYLDNTSNDIVILSPVLGNNAEDLIQIWTAPGRLLQFTFPETGVEPTFHREVWHKWWKRRYQFTDASLLSQLYSRYLPETGDFFSCAGCGESGLAPCSYSWQCSPTCSSCYGPGQTECTSCPPGSSLENGACVKTCSDNQYRKSKTECFDCPADYTYIKSNLTCLNCWDHNDYKECGFTRLAYNISLVQDSFLNISFTYSISFYGEKKSLDKLNDTSINWPRIFRVENLKEKSRGPECEKPRYSYDHEKKHLKIGLKECEREAKFYLRTLRTKMIQDRYKVPLMVNLSSNDPLNNKILKADDDIPIYYRFLRFLLWALFLIFLLYLLLSELEFINNQPMKMIGNFLKMVDFIQCLALLEVEYRVLTKKFFWLIELIFSSPEFELFEGYLNDKEDLRREGYMGKVYEEYGDKMAFNNYDLVISVYFISIIADIVVGFLPWKIKRVRNVAGGFREFMYSYAFFEFFINILMDLSNIKKIIKRGNWLTWLFIAFEGMIILTEIRRFIKKITELDAEKEEENPKEEENEESIKDTIRDNMGSKFNLDSERDSLVNKTEKKSHERFHRGRRQNRTVGWTLSGLVNRDLDL